MAAVINTNMASLNTQRNLGASQSQLNTSIQRLSSGLRINSAKDDAAGLAISQRFTSQINGLNQAARNANDGISLAQTAEGALSQVGDALQRMRELSVQSANATNSSSDRAALQQEVSQLASEIARIGNTTSFNGLKILDGSYTGQQYQVGANAGETITLSVGDSRATNLGATAVTSTSTGILSSASLTTGITINGTAIATTTATSFSDVINLVNAQSGTTGVTAQRATTNGATLAYTTATAAENLQINGVTVGIAIGDTAAAAATKINNASTQSGVTATVSGGNLVFSASGGADITLKSDLASSALTGVSTTAATYTAGIQLSTKLGGALTVAGTLGTTLNLATATAADFKVSSLDISSTTGANTAIQTIDFALSQVSGTRASLGAVQNRFSAVVSNLQSASENFSAARSRILDADFAAETATLTRGQILQQAGTAMLAQANSLPNNVLSLLRG
ncbi:MAG: flagellin [Rhizobium sp.]